jgi:ParB/RepB/Spo0J family partition protein
VIELLPLASIEEDPNQPRTDFSEAALEELAVNIETTAGASQQPWIDGLLHPVTVYPNPGWAEGSAGPRWRLLTGGRRLRTYRLRRWPLIPAQVRPAPESPFRALVIQLNENLGRKDTSIWEDARAVEQALTLWRFEQPGGAKGDFAERLGRSRAWVSHRLMIARATGVAKQALVEKRIGSVEAYRAFVGLAPTVQIELLERVRRSCEPITPGLLKPYLPRGKAARQLAAGARPSPAAKGDASSAPESSEAPRSLTLEVTVEQARFLLYLLHHSIPEEPAEVKAALVEALAKIEP